MENFNTTTIEIRRRPEPSRERRDERDHSRGFSRIYVHPANETLLDNLINRRSRPWTAYKKIVLPAVEWELKRLGLLPVGTKLKASWSKHAGCAMCPCSPGFVLWDHPEMLGIDIWVTVDRPDMTCFAEWNSREVIEKTMQRPGFVAARGRVGLDTFADIENVLNIIEEIDTSVPK